MSLTDSEKTDIRRFCGYPAYGVGATSFQGWRFYQAYGMLEYRLNNLSTPELSVARRYIATLISLEVGIPASAANLDTDQAAVWSRNPNELRDRTRLFDDWRRRFCGFLGVPPGAELNDKSITLIV